jgi:hypothetical protein
MKILIDESLPRYLKKILAGYDAKTVQEMGWGGIKNGPLLALAESHFDIFLTADKNLRYQQNLTGLRLVIIVFPSNKLSVVKTLDAELKSKIATATVGDYIELW